eukprot:Nitzschia sp. Nitz4//scaffold4_size323378//29743//30882//NITZ4_000616-RA/size323378-processed-gene-0.327-mRNA-1//-1//CDS//3329553267//8891//frame0
MAENDNTTPTEPVDEAKTVEEVKGRLKFFFSDANVRQDPFMRKLLMNDKGEPPKMVPIDSLLRFNTIKFHTTDASIVAKAAKELSESLTLDDKETAIGRVVEFTQEMMDGHIPKSLQVKGLPLKQKDADEKEKQYAVSVDQVRELFQPYGEVALVKLIWGFDGDKGKKKVPIGSAIVEFESEEALQKAAEATLTIKAGEEQEAKEKLVIGDNKTELKVMLLSETKRYSKEKGGSPRKRKNHDDNGDNEEVKKFEVDWKPNCVIKLKGVPSDCDRESLLDMLAAGMDISVQEVKDKKIYVDYSRGHEDGALRFPEPGEHIPTICASLKEGKLEIKGSKVNDAFILEGDEEKKYWEEFIAFKNRQIQQRADERRSKKKQRR